MQLDSILLDILFQTNEPVLLIKNNLNHVAQFFTSMEINKYQLSFTSVAVDNLAASLHSSVDMNSARSHSDVSQKLKLAGTF